MKDVVLKNGVRMPILGMGTWQLTGPDCNEAVKTAIDIGYNHIDTAEAYGNEQQIGLALKDKGVDRDKLFITSKVWISNFSYDGVLRANQESLDKLGTQYLDLYLIHWPDSSQDLRKTIKAMKALYDKGKIRAFGVSNFTMAHLKKALEISEEEGIPLTVNQVEFHPGLYQKELHDFCRKNGVVLTAYSPLTRGDVLENPVIREIADKHGKSPAQVALKWIVQKDIIAIPKASSEEHLRDNFEIDDLELDQEDIEKIDAIGSDHRLLTPPFSEFDKEEVFEATT